MFTTLTAPAVDAAQDARNERGTPEAPGPTRKETAVATTTKARSEGYTRRLVLSGVLGLLLATAGLFSFGESAPVALAGKPSYACSLTGPDGTPYAGVTFGSRKEAAEWEATFEAAGYSVTCVRVRA